MTGGRHRIGRRLRRRRLLTTVATVELRTVDEVLLEDGGWYRVLNQSFSVAPLKLTERSQTSNLGDGFYFYGADGRRIAGPLSAIRAVRQDSRLMFSDGDGHLDLFGLFQPSP